MTLNRRDFLKGMGATALVAGGSAILGGCASETPAPEQAQQPAQDAAPALEVSELTGWTGTPEHIAALGGSTMPLADLNALRKAYIDKQTDYTREDGTVVPAVFVKVRALIHTYGMGCGNTPIDNSFDSIMDKFSEDDAQAFLDMPMGVKFTAVDLYERTGRPMDECVELCDRLAAGGFLYRIETHNGPTYNHLPYFQGVVEYHFTQTMAQPDYSIGVMGADMLPGDMATTGTPTFYTVPCDKSVVEGGVVLPHDDVEGMLRGKKVVIAPCFCRYTTLAKSDVTDYPSFEDFATGEFEDYFSPLCDLRVETCLLVGEEADYSLYKGIAREITDEQAIEYVRRSRDDGFIIHSVFTKDSGTVCSCHSRTCGILKFWSTLGSDEAIAAAPSFDQVSHYRLEWDNEACLKCGICANRCPVGLITTDGEDGAPTQSDRCIRCGQCAYVCPQQARKLVVRPDEEMLELPKTFMDDYNMKAAYRFEHGLIV